ncbi:HAMP domain-containing protein, partial [Angustibacter luteus]
MHLLRLDRSIGRRLAAAFGLVCLLLAVVAGVGLWGQNVQSDTRTQMKQVQTVRDQLQELRYLDADVSGWQAYLWMHAVVDGGSKAADPAGESVKGIMDDKAAGAKIFEGLSTLDLSPAEKATATKTAALWDAYFASTDKMIAALRTDTPAGTKTAYDMLSTGDLDTQWSALLTQSEQLIKYADARAATLATQADHDATLVWTVVLICAAVAVALAAAAGLLVTRSIVRPIRKVQHALTAMADGDLTARANVTGSDEVARMAAALNAAQESVRVVVEQV